MSADSFSVLIKTEQEAAAIIRAAKDRRKDIMKEHERALTQEIDAFKQAEHNRIQMEMQQQDAAEGNKGSEEETEVLRTIAEIQKQSAQNMNTMVNFLVETVASV
eukprot:TRINITY_DN20883_c0_g1_i1.p5 TRINITY_DN20883_c0_g1~~TRINITY_DN20883_c0_g1_i1.p5  ORF type:complete len:105 (+),score=63.30 TRINITY_DN20883_c0_g1_i1:67-381(+)